MRFKLLLTACRRIHEELPSRVLPVVRCRAQGGRRLKRAGFSRLISAESSAWDVPGKHGTCWKRGGSVCVLSFKCMHADRKRTAPPAIVNAVGTFWSVRRGRETFRKLGKARFPKGEESREKWGGNSLLAGKRLMVILASRTPVLRAPHVREPSFAASAAGSGSRPMAPRRPPLQP